MYLLNVNATAHENEITEIKEPHTKWVKEGFAKGWFLFAGPKSAKLGGLILVKPVSKSDLEEFIALDPYVINKVADYEIIDFNVALTTKGLEALNA